MRFKINEIGENGLTLDVAVTSEWLVAVCPDLEARPAASGLKLRGRLSRNGDDYMLLGRLGGGLEATCGRCLEPARVPVDATVSVTFVPADDDDDVGDDADVIGFAGNEIDIGDELRDEILLALPVKPLCREDCLGLCSVCGGNRNVNRCDCEEQARQASSRFAAIGNLKI